ncbi:uncharacterized protein BKA78DRAFT_349099 [Phyllosticta capitalensis]|uniref:uncharacterized protein n=1 Tax=Phyllosticta capitalensis TaxID=121624 RepID=UPI00312CCC8F
MNPVSMPNLRARSPVRLPDPQETFIAPRMAKKPTASEVRFKRESQAMSKAGDRMIWTDGYHQMILRVAPLLAELSPTARLEATPKTVRKIERIGGTLIRILTGWNQRNVQLYKDMSLDVKGAATGATSLAVFLRMDTQLQAVSTKEACEANMATASVMQNFFQDWIGWKLTIGDMLEDDEAYFEVVTVEEQRVRSCLVCLRDRFNDVMLSAENAHAVAISLWEQLDELQAVQQEHEEEKVANKREQDKQQKPMRRLLSLLRYGKNGRRPKPVTISGSGHKSTHNLIEGSKGKVMHPDGGDKELNLAGLCLHPRLKSAPDLLAQSTTAGRD